MEKNFVKLCDTYIDVNQIAILSFRIEKDDKDIAKKYSIVITLINNSVPHQYDYDATQEDIFREHYFAIRDAMVNDTVTDA